MNTIDREAALKLLKDRRNFLFRVWQEHQSSGAADLHLEALENTEAIYEMIADMPYREEKEGRWVLKRVEPDGEFKWECSECMEYGGEWSGLTPPPFEYCPHCGTKMRREKKQNDQS